MMRHKHLLFVPILVISLVTLSHNLHGQDVWRRIDLPEEYRNYILGGIAAKSLMEMVVIARTEPYGGNDVPYCVLYTTNGGADWTTTEVWCGEDSNFPQSIWYLGDDTWYRKMNWAPHRTRGYGNPWKPAPMHLVFDKIQDIDEEYLWLTGDNGESGKDAINISTDRGASFSLVALDSKSVSRSLAMRTKTEGILAISKYSEDIYNDFTRIYKTDDNWKTMTEIENTGLPLIIYSSLAYAEDSTLILAGRQESINVPGKWHMWRSTDNGVSWVPVEFFNTLNYIQDLYFPEKGAIGYAVSPGNRLYRTTNSGLSWTVVSPPVPVPALDSYIVPFTNNIVFLLRPGTIYYTTTGGVSDVNEATTHDNPSPLSIYPNPADDAITVRGMEPGTAYHVVDILGQVVRTLLPDASELKFSLMDLPPGVYTLVSPLHRIQFIRR